MSHISFEGQGNIKFDVQQCLKELVVREVRGKVKALVPAKSYLFILKLKSVWDRTYRLENDLSKDVEWEKGKLAKDCGDILSLLDHVEPLDRFVLRDFFEQYPFLRSAFSFVANSDFSPGKFLPYRPKNTVELIRSIKKIGSSHIIGDEY